MKPDPKDHPEDFEQLFAERERHDATIDMPQTASDDPGAASSDFDATCLFEPGSFAKREQDVAAGLAALSAQLVTERQLVSAVKDWTIHGDEPLMAHLVQKNLITQEQREDLEQKAARNLEIASGRASRGERTGDSDGTATLVELDPTGRIPRLLGIRLATELADADRVRHADSEYRLLRRLGQGGMGTVWLARDEKLGRLVAIKEIRSAANENEIALHRFRREAKVTGRLEHPSIVPVHQLGDNSESGRVFYVMRFIGKRTLEDAIGEYHERRDAGDTNPMHLHQLLTAFVTVCQAIAYAHSRNVVHRDLKPENIALDDYGQVIVLDWGLAKLTGRGDMQEAFGDIELGDMTAGAQSMAGQVLGTPMYMAPEQAAGRLDEIEQTTDVYGLGAILFAILTGCAPHEMSQQSLSSTSKVSELLQVIVSNPSPDAREANADAPPELAAICAKAMSSKRYARYDNALALADDVQRYMAGEPVSTYQEPWRKRARRWIQKHRRLSLLGAACLTIALVTAITLGITAHENRMVAEQNRFEGLRADARELVVSLQNVSKQLAKDARFMAALPPIQGIATFEAGGDTDSKDVWQKRLETIYRGLLESNPYRLSATYATAAFPKDHPSTMPKTQESSSLQQLAHVERHEAEGPVRVQPRSRLARVQVNDFFAKVLQIQPGDVTVHAVREHYEGTSAAADMMVLAAGTPVYGDINGKLFGAVTVETDLQQTIRELLVNTIETDEDAYIVDSEGLVLMHYSRNHDFQLTSVGREIGDLVPSTQPFFETDGASDQFSDGHQVYAVKVRIDPRHSSEYLGIVLTVDQ